MTPSELRIVLADDHPIVLEALELSLSKAGFDVVGTYVNRQDAIDGCLRLEPDILLTDLLMAEGNGLDTARTIRKLLPNCKVIILTGGRSPRYLARAVQMHVEGYLSKSIPFNTLVNAILEVAGGRQVLDPDLIAEATTVQGDRESDATCHPRREPVMPLTRQETRVLKLISSGLSNAEIASLLKLSPHTIKTHVRHIYAKLDVSDRTTAAIWAFRAGVVSINETSPSAPQSGV